MFSTHIHLLYHSDYPNLHTYLFTMTFSDSVLGEEDTSQHQVDAVGYNKLEISAEVEDTEQR